MSGEVMWTAGDTAQLLDLVDAFLKELKGDECRSKGVARHQAIEAFETRYADLAERARRFHEVPEASGTAATGEGSTGNVGVNPLPPLPATLLIPPQGDSGGVGPG
jgi:hypothetical protein